MSKQNSQQIFKLWLKPGFLCSLATEIMDVHNHESNTDPSLAHLPGFQQAMYLFIFKSNT